MLKRITTWLTGLAFLVEFRKLVTSLAESAKSQTEALPAWQRRARFEAMRRGMPFTMQQRRFTLPSRKRRLPFMRRQSGFTLPWQRRNATMGWLRPLLLGLGLGAGLTYVFYTWMMNRRNGGGQLMGATGTDWQGRTSDSVSDTQQARYGAEGTGFFAGRGSDFERMQPGQPWGGLTQAPSEPTTRFGDRTGDFTGEHTGESSSAVTGRRTPGASAEPIIGETLVEVSVEYTDQYDWEGSGGEIPRADWDHFCERFTEQYMGRRVTVEARHSDGSQSTIAMDRPLLALSNEQHDGAFDLRVVLGDGINEQLAHNITNVESLHLQTGALGAAEMLEARSADGTTTVQLL